MKNYIIGALTASLLLLATGATGKADKWDNQQQWQTGTVYVIDKGKAFALFIGDTSNTPIGSEKWPTGWEPIQWVDQGHQGQPKIKKGVGVASEIWQVRRRVK